MIGPLSAESSEDKEEEEGEFAGESLGDTAVELDEVEGIESKVVVRLTAPRVRGIAVVDMIVGVQLIECCSRVKLQVTKRGDLGTRSSNRGALLGRSIVELNGQKMLGCLLLRSCNDQQARVSESCEVVDAIEDCRNGAIEDS